MSARSQAARNRIVGIGTEPESPRAKRRNLGKTAIS
jgi:hypothetical protein